MSIAFSHAAPRLRPVNAPGEPPIHWPSALVGLGLAVLVVVGVSWMATPQRLDRSTPVAVAAPIATPAPTPIPAPVLTSPTPEPIVERVKVAFTNGTGVNLRAKAGEKAQRLKTVPEGTVLEVVGGDQVADGLSWRNVKDANGTTGWVAAKFVATSQP